MIGSIAVAAAAIVAIIWLLDWALPVDVWGRIGSGLGLTTERTVEADVQARTAVAVAGLLLIIIWIGRRGL